MAGEFPKGFCIWTMTDGVWVLTDKCEAGGKCHLIEGENTPLDDQGGQIITTAQLLVLLRKVGLPESLAGQAEVKIPCE